VTTPIIASTIIIPSTLGKITIFVIITKRGAAICLKDLKRLLGCLIQPAVTQLDMAGTERSVVVEADTIGLPPIRVANIRGPTVLFARVTLLSR
jgi:hypothetical protein